MAKIQIEKNVPVPTNIRRKYPLDQMEVGDSFVVKDVKKSSVYAQTVDYTKKSETPKKFIVRDVEDGVRCWRVE